MQNNLAQGSAQRRVNDAVWGRGDFVGTYATRTLRPVETVLLARYREAFSGRVLEIGCGAGRITGYAIQLGGDVTGVDLSPRMVEHCRRTYPEGRFQQGNLGSLQGFEAGAFDLVLAANNLIDVLGDAERCEVLGSMALLLAPGGLLIFSSHNRAHEPLIPSPFAAVRTAGVLHALHRAPRLPRWMANRRRLSLHERRTERYAVLNDEAHGFKLLHYYIDRDEQEQQLFERGYVLVECLDEDGRLVAAGESAPWHGELHYVARTA